MGRLAVLAGDEADERNRTFVLQNESHTLGNALKDIISQYKEVEFCGYTVPHPAENNINFRIQTAPNYRAVDMLQKGLQDLEKVCDIVIDKFNKAVDKYENEKHKTMDTS